MAWSDILRKLGLGEDDEDDLMMKPESRTSERKAMMAQEMMEREKSKPGSGREYARSTEFKTERGAENDAIDERDRRRILEIIKKQRRGTTDKEAEMVLEELGGPSGFYSKRTMVDEKEPEIQKETIRRIIDGIRKDEMGLDEY